MKKNVLSLSISAAVLSLGMVGGAHAIGVIGFGGGTTANLSTGGGHTNIVPYYTTQSVVVGGDSTNGMQKTLVNIVNTDQTNGKAVKVRFRSATNSDDVFDFQVFLSPADVYSFEVNQDPTTGLSRLASGDTSCTKPNVRIATNAQLSFKTTRLDNTAVTATAVTRAAATREGYIEILNMADIRPLNHTPGAANIGTEAALTSANALFTAIKHVADVAPLPNKAPPCTGPAFTALDTDLADMVAAAGAGLARPTPTLVTNWTIVNTTNSSVYGGEATSIFYGNTNLAPAAAGTSTTTTAFANQANLVYWPQSTAPVATADNFTADPLLRNGAAALVQPLMQDLPDTSTPAMNIASVSTVTTGPIAQAELISSLLARTSVTNEYLTTTSIAAATDWTFTMPTRRYGVVYNYADGLAYFNPLAGGAPTIAGLASAYFQPSNSKANATRRMVCVQGITPVSFDREETTPSTVQFSPVGTPSLCGEASVLTINNIGGVSSMLASLTVTDVDATYREGWLTMALAGLPLITRDAAVLGAGTTSAGLPVIGHSYTRASTGSTRLGAVYRHR